MLTKIFNTILTSNFDSSGLNLEWKSAISVDERSLLKKFFKNTGPQFKHLKDVWTEDFCTRLRCKILCPNEILKHRNAESDTIYFIVTGRISIYDPKWNSGEYILSNHYWPGQSVCDPEQN